MPTPEGTAVERAITRTGTVQGSYWFVMWAHRSHEVLTGAGAGDLTLFGGGIYILMPLLFLFCTVYATWGFGGVDAGKLVGVVVVSALTAFCHFGFCYPVYVCYFITFYGCLLIFGHYGPMLEKSTASCIESPWNWLVYPGTHKKKMVVLLFAFAMSLYVDPALVPEPILGLLMGDDPVPYLCALTSAGPWLFMRGQTPMAAFVLWAVCWAQSAGAVGLTPTPVLRGFFSFCADPETTVLALLVTFIFSVFLICGASAGRPSGVPAAPMAYRAASLLISMIPLF
jgi:hypothetical protein